MARPRGQAARGRRVPFVRIAVVLLGTLAALRILGGGEASDESRGAGDVAAATRSSPRPPTARPAPGREVYGYVPYWEMDDSLPEHVAGTALTTLALFSVSQRADGRLDTGEPGYRRIDGAVGRQLVAEARERGTRVELVWSSFGPDKNGPFFSDAAAQKRWVTTLVALALERGFDGINVDVEGLPPQHLPAYGALITRLREALRAADADAQVSVATGGGAIGAAMAATAGAAGADRIFLMGYDYRTGRSQPGATAPLNRVDGEEKDLAWSLDLYGTLQVPVERTILGLPLYGVTWPVAKPDPWAAASGRGEAWIPRRHLRDLRAESFKPKLDEIEGVEFFAFKHGSGWQAVYYDSPRTLTPKLALAEERGLAGVGFWAIGYERGLPGYTTLIEEFSAAH